MAVGYEHVMNVGKADSCLLHPFKNTIAAPRIGQEILMLRKLQKETGVIALCCHRHSGSEKDKLFHRFPSIDKKDSCHHR
jgi:hypothetical protein